MAGRTRRSPASTAGAPRWGTLLALALLLAFGFLGSRGLWEPDEGRYVEVAREMVVSGNWLVPTLHGLPHLSKPPLTYWAIALPLALWGFSGWTARLYLGLALVATILLLARFGEELWDDPRGRWAGPIFGTSLLPFAAASVATTDGLLVAWETAAVWAFWRGWSAGEAAPRAGRGWTTLGWGLLGVAFLVKGPPALLPLLGWATFTVLVKDPRRRWGWLAPPGPMVFAAVALPWFLLLFLSGRGVAGWLLLHEVAERVGSGAHHRNSAWWKALGVYGPALLLGGLPWTIAWPALLRRSRWRALRTRPRALLLACWFAVPLAVFLVARSRLPFYVVPLFAPLSLALAGVARAGDGTPVPRVLRRPGRVALPALALLLALRALAAAFPPAWDSGALAREIRARVPPGLLARAEVFPLGTSIHGLGPYLDVDAEDRDGRVGQGPTWWRPGPLDGELRELAFSTHPHLLLAPERKAPRFRKALHRAGARCEDLGEARGTRLWLCPGRRREPAVDRVLLAVAPRGDLRASFVAAWNTFELWEEHGAALVLLVEPPGLPVRVADVPPGRLLWRLWHRRVPVLVLRLGDGRLAVDGRFVPPGVPAPTVRGEGRGRLLVRPRPGVEPLVIALDAGPGHPSAARTTLFLRPGFPGGPPGSLLVRLPGVPGARPLAPGEAGILAGGPAGLRWEERPGDGKGRLQAGTAPSATGVAVSSISSSVGFVPSWPRRRGRPSITVSR